MEMNKFAKIQCIVASVLVLFVSGCSERRDHGVESVAANNGVSIVEKDDKKLSDMFNDHEMWRMSSSDGGITRYLVFDTNCSGHAEVMSDIYYKTVSFLYSSSSCDISFTFDDGLSIDFMDLCKNDDGLSAFEVDNNGRYEWSFVPCDDIKDNSNFFVRDSVFVENNDTECCGAEGCDCGGDMSECITYNSENGSNGEYEFF